MGQETVATRSRRNCLHHKRFKLWVLSARSVFGCAPLPRVLLSLAEQTPPLSNSRSIETPNQAISSPEKTDFCVRAASKHLRFGFACQAGLIRLRQKNGWHKNRARDPGLSPPFVIFLPTIFLPQSLFVTACTTSCLNYVYFLRAVFLVARYLWRLRD